MGGNWALWDQWRPPPPEPEPFKHYDEYFQGRDKFYASLGQPGFHKAVMERSNPETVAAYNKIVDELNAALPGLIQAEDRDGILALYKKAEALKKKPAETSEE